MDEISKACAAENRGKDEAEREEFNTLRDEIKAIDAEIKDLHDMEKLNPVKATPVDGKSTKSASESREYVSVKNT